MRLIDVNDNLTEKYEHTKHQIKRI